MQQIQLSVILRHWASDVTGIFYPMEEKQINLGVIWNKSSFTKKETIYVQKLKACDLLYTESIAKFFKELNYLKRMIYYKFGQGILNILKYFKDALFVFQNQ
mgnify:CR=1 FL=1